MLDRENQVDTSLEVSIGAGRCLRLSFLWTGDRYGHRIEWTDRGQLLAAIESEAAEDDRVWPSSPPLQQLSVTPTADGSPVALLVGMAGRSHWSASAEAVPGRGWRFDVACRCHRAPGWLGSSYRVLRGDARRDAERIAIRGGSCCGEILPRPLPDCPDPQLQLARDRVTLAASTPVGALPVTVRWQYLVQWTAASQET